MGVAAAGWNAWHGPPTCRSMQTRLPHLAAAECNHTACSIGLPLSETTHKDHRLPLGANTHSMRHQRTAQCKHTRMVPFLPAAQCKHTQMLSHPKRHATQCDKHMPPQTACCSVQINNHTCRLTWLPFKATLGCLFSVHPATSHTAAACCTVQHMQTHAACWSAQCNHPQAACCTVQTRKSAHSCPEPDMTTSPCHCLPSKAQRSAPLQTTLPNPRFRRLREVVLNNTSWLFIVCLAGATAPRPRI